MNRISSNQQQIFEQNRAFFAKRQPQVAYLLSFPVRESSTFSLADEAEKEFFQVVSSSCSVVYVYGIEFASIAGAARNWLCQDSERHIVFLEDDKELLGAFLSKDCAKEILDCAQISLYYFAGIENLQEVLADIFWDFALQQMVFICSPTKDKEKFDELKYAITYEAAVKNAGIDEYLRFGLSFFRNYYPNLLQIYNSFDGSRHFGRYEKIPAIICGAGPSLEKNIDQLPGLLDRAIIFGGGSALNALSARGILPHFGIGVDPNPAQKVRIESQQAYEVPVFYRCRVHKEAFSCIHGPKLYIRGAGGYDIADYVDEQLGLQGEEWIDEGHNVVNFGLELAYKMGCDPIILVGVDLAYTDLQAYAGGVEEDVSVHVEQITGTGDFDTDAVKRKDIFGKPIYTLWKWIAESNWIAIFAKERLFVKIINATQGGLGMEGIENLPLRQVAEKYLTRSYDLSGRVFSLIGPAKLSVTKEQVLGVVRELKKSFVRSEEHLNVLEEENVRLRDILEKTRSVPDPIQTGLGALAETELSEEPAYKYILELFHVVYAKLLNKKVQALHAQKEKMPPWLFEKEKAVLSAEKLVFMRKVAIVNKKIIDEAIKEAVGE